jgi:hypothetical protein
MTIESVMMNAGCEAHALLPPHKSLPPGGPRRRRDPVGEGQECAAVPLKPFPLWGGSTPSECEAAGWGLFVQSATRGREGARGSFVIP